MCRVRPSSIIGGDTIDNYGVSRCRSGVGGGGRRPGSPGPPNFVAPISVADAPPMRNVGKIWLGSPLSHYKNPGYALCVTNYPTFSGIAVLSHQLSCWIYRFNFSMYLSPITASSITVHCFCVLCTGCGIPAVSPLPPLRASVTVLSHLITSNKDTICGHQTGDPNTYCTCFFIPPLQY